MDPSADAFRFADAASKKVKREVAAYGGTVTPDAILTSVTGITRGEELFHRPDLHRPWRTMSAQKHSDNIAAKEYEIEKLVQKCTEYRSQLAKATRELHKQQAQTNAEVAKLTAVKDQKIAELDGTINELKATIEKQKMQHEHQLRVVNSERSAEITGMNVKMQAIQQAANETGSCSYKQIQDVKAAAQREVELVQRLCHARTSELQNELVAAQEANAKMQERHNAGIAEMQAEMKRSEDRCVSQLKEQEMRNNIARDHLLREKQMIETARDKYFAELSSMKDETKTLNFDLNETESRSKEWNMRVLNDLDQLYDYYSGVVREVEAVTDDQPAHFSSSAGVLYSPPRQSKDDTVRSTVDKISQRLQSLTVIKQKHSTATQAMVKKIKALEAAVQTSQESFQRHADEKDVQITRLHSEVGQIKARQQRLDGAYQELWVQFTETNQKLKNTTHRLQFFNSDHALSLQHYASAWMSRPPPPQERAAIVTTTVEGAVVQWEKDPALMQSALSMMNEVIRAKLQQYAGYEATTDADSMIIAFADSEQAIRFCLETQEWLVQVRWPRELLDNHDSREEVGPDGHVAFRGLRLGMAVHYGEVFSETTNQPTGVGELKVQYYGSTVIQALALASRCHGGQVLVSGEAWGSVKDRLHDLGSPQFTDLGEHRLDADGSSSTFQHGTAQDSVLMHIVQVLPQRLRHRTYKSLLDMKATGGIAHHYTQFRRLALSSEVNNIKNVHLALSGAVSALQEESKAVATAVSALGCKLRDAQVHGRIYTQSDIITHVAALDRVVARVDILKRDMEKAAVSQQGNEAQMKSLEHALMVQTKMSVSEAEFKKRIEILQLRANEQMHETKLQCAQRIQQMTNNVSKSEHTINSLRNQIHSGSVQSIEEVLGRERKASAQEKQDLQKQVESLTAQVEKLRSLTRFQDVPRVGKTPTANRSASRLSSPTKSSEGKSKKKQQLLDSVNEMRASMASTTASRPGTAASRPDTAGSTAH